MRGALLPAAVLTAVVSASGCLVGEVTGISCDGDDACPTDYFCDLPRSECRELTDTFGPPLLQVKLVADPAGRPVTTPFVPPEVTSTIALLPENVGGSQAENVSLSFAFLNCIGLDVDKATLPEVIDADASGRIDVDVTPGPGCEGLTIVDWFLAYSGRETRGTFDVNVKAL